MKGQLWTFILVSILTHEVHSFHVGATLIVRIGTRRLSNGEGMNGPKVEQRVTLTKFGAAQNFKHIIKHGL